MMPNNWRLFAFGILILLGTLNREMTGALLLFSWLVLYGWRGWKLSIGYGVLAIATFIGLRVAIGIEETQYTVDYMWQHNLDTWRLSLALFYHLLFALIWSVVWINRREMPSPYQRLLLILIPYAVLLLVLASWREVRLLMPFALILLPIMKIRLH